MRCPHAILIWRARAAEYMSASCIMTTAKRTDALQKVSVWSVKNKKPTVVSHLAAIWPAISRPRLHFLPMRKNHLAVLLFLNDDVFLEKRVGVKSVCQSETVINASAESHINSTVTATCYSNSPWLLWLPRSLTPLHTLMHEACMSGLRV